MREIFQYPKREKFSAGAIRADDKLFKRSKQKVTPRLVIGFRGQTLAALAFVTDVLVIKIKIIVKFMEQIRI
jgi:hypothetical protein